MTLPAPRRRAEEATSIATLPPPTTTTFLPTAGFLPDVDIFQEGERLENAAGILAGHVELGAVLRADGYENGAVALLLEVFRIAHGAIGLDFDAHLLQGGDFPFHDFPGKAMLRNAEGHHAAGDGSRLENGDGIAFLNQEVSGGQTGGAGTDHGYFLFLGDGQFLRQALGFEVGMSGRPFSIT